MLNAAHSAGLKVVHFAILGYGCLAEVCGVDNIVGCVDNTLCAIISGAHGVIMRNTQLKEDAVSAYYRISFSTSYRYDFSFGQ